MNVVRGISVSDRVSLGEAGKERREEEKTEKGPQTRTGGHNIEANKQKLTGSPRDYRTVTV